MLTLACFLIISGVFNIGLDEINCQNIIASAVSSSRTAILIASQEEHRIQTKLYIVERQSKKARQVEDGRVLLSASSRVFPFKSGFAVVVCNQKMIYFLDNQGDFMDLLRLDQLPELSSPAVRVSHANILDDHSVALTYGNLTDPGTLILAAFDFSHRTLKELNAVSTNDGFWLKSQNQWLFIDDKTSKITSLNEQFKPISVLRPAQETIKYEINAEIRKLMEERGLSSLANRIVGSFIDGPRVSFWLCTYPPEGAVAKPKYTQLEIEGGKLFTNKTNELRIATWGDQGIKYDQNESILFVK